MHQPGTTQNPSLPSEDELQVQVPKANLYPKDTETGFHGFERERERGGERQEEVEVEREREQEREGEEDSEGSWWVKI